MTWRIWPSRSIVRLRISLGYSPGSWIRCMNLLIEHDVHLLELNTEGDRSHYAVGPSAIEMTLRYPGEGGSKPSLRP
jgi:hypothetical protein